MINVCHPLIQSGPAGYKRVLLMAFINRLCCCSSFQLHLHSGHINVAYVITPHREQATGVRSIPTASRPPMGRILRIGTTRITLPYWIQLYERPAAKSLQRECPTPSHDGLRDRNEYLFPIDREVYEELANTWAAATRVL